MRRHRPVDVLGGQRRRRRRPGVIFASFANYDDEGTVLVTLNAFAHGQPLYTDIFTPYRPFFFEFFGGLADLSGHAFTTDGSRTAGSSSGLRPASSWAWPVSASPGDWRSASPG